MAEPPLKKCPSCRGLKLKKLFGVPNAICRGIEHAKTVGQAGEENTRRLVEQHGHEVAQDIIHQKVYGQGGKQLKLPRKARTIERPAENEVPWWRSGQVEGTGPMKETPINPGDIKDPVRYIRTGEKE